VALTLIRSQAAHRDEGAADRRELAKLPELLRAPG
jgi:hypothetical protein